MAHGLFSETVLFGGKDFFISQSFIYYSYFTPVKEQHFSTSRHYPHITAQAKKT